MINVISYIHMNIIIIISGDLNPLYNIVGFL